MAVDQDLLDDIAASIADLYRSVETALVKTVAARLRAELPLPSPYQEEKLDAVRALRASAVSVIAALQASKATVIRDAVANAYRHGSGSALTDLPDQFFPNSGIGTRAEAARKVIPNTAQIEAIASAIHRDTGRVERNILRNVLDGYREVQAATAARIATGTETRRQASQAAWQRLMDKGLTSFTDSANRRWRLSSYVEMIGRTNVSRAALTGQTDRLKSLDVDLVIVSNNSQECKLCRPYEGQILSLDGPTGDVEVEHATRDDEMVTVHVKATLRQAQAAGLNHPNCRHSVSAYTPGITKQPTATADPEGNKARQRQRLLERKIRSAKEQEVGALTPEAKKAAGAQVRAAQAALRDHLKANPKLKRLPYRERIGAGNLPGPNGPQGGPAQDLGPTVQPTLDGRPAPAPARRTPDQAVSRIREDGQNGQLDLDDAIVEEPPAAKPKKARVRTRPIPAGAKPFHRALDPEQRALADAVKDKNLPGDDYDDHRTRRLGGASAETFLVDLANGVKVIRKRGKPGLDEMQDADAEQAAYMVAKALDLKAPAVYRSDDTNLWMRYADGADSPEEDGSWGMAARFNHLPKSDEGRRLGLLDIVVGNIDRNLGNWLVDPDGHLVPIDHGMAWGNASYNPEFQFIRNPFTEGMEESNPFTAEDLAEVRQRLEALRPDFEHLGKTSWLTYSLKALDYMAERATGTRNLIAGVA